MQEPELPTDEAARLESLKRLAILDTPPEERFDRITRLTRILLRAPIALVTLVDEERQWFKSAQGLVDPETPRTASFCAHAILEEETMVVGDAQRDERFADNPLVLDHPNIRMYAGTPIHSPDGLRIGTLCVIDLAPRKLSEEELAQLEDLGSLVEISLRAEVLGETERELRAQLSAAERKALLDPLTRLWNREMLERVLTNEIARSARRALDLTVMMIDLDNFKRVNDTYGHLAGDCVLREASGRIRRSLRDYDTLGRYGGEEFLVVLPECATEGARFIAERALDNLRSQPIETPEGAVSITASIGSCTLRPLSDTPSEALINATDRAMYQAKKDGRDCHRMLNRID